MYIPRNGSTTADAAQRVARSGEPRNNKIDLTTRFTACSFV